MARTGQDLLNLMEILHPELQLQVGENDVTKGLRALNASQYHFENLLALQPELLGDSIGTVTTTANTEYTTFPSTCLRLDRLQYVDSVTNRPTWDLVPIRRSGGHVLTPGWPYNVLNFVTTTSGGGKPTAYYTDGARIYWVPLPDATYTVRWYGFGPAADITASGTFSYPDACMLPMATFAVKVIRLGLDDPVENYSELAQEVFNPVIQMLGNFKKEQAPGYNYTTLHTT